ncbi:hypothetical protein O6H91_09G038500 [Diphasiastrum complanatum]|uniref:Uncharacterized protein n=2 Tax=Diphasiastrum complanatum TaxID=34168 RepID=A0ACC2CN40_DIPCM|nr:hypothetical protein O6H91_09G038500 [Diphasiastrum complanatum]KAJ7543441.1 hypothetical protein O6H91_09G038500 [Diphasiastrum complanatum]
MAEEPEAQIVAAPEAVELDQTQTDESIAAMIHVQQLQQKQEVTQLMESHPVPHADAEFRRGLEELVRDHLHTCMALASCSSPHDGGRTNGNSSSHARTPSFTSLQEDAGDSHMQHQLDLSERCDCHNQLGVAGEPHYCHSGYHCLVHGGEEDHEEEEEEEGDDLLIRQRGRGSEEHTRASHRPSFLSRRQSRILSRWYERQAEEMINTMERQARQAELLALAGLHTVSMLDASFLQQSSSGRSQRSVERPQRMSSPLVQMWRDLEGERTPDRERTQSRGRSMTSPAAALTAADRRLDVDRPEFYQNNPDNQPYYQMDAETSPFYQTDPEVEQRDSSDDSDDEQGDQVAPHLSEQEEIENAATAFSNGDTPGWQANEDNISAMGQAGLRDNEGESTSVGQGEGERVRQAVQRWMNDSGMVNNESNAARHNRGEWLGEDERERVRALAREWVRVSNQPRPESVDIETEHSDVQYRNLRRREREREDFADNLEENLSRDVRRRRDRQLILDLIMRTERERQRELEGLSEYRAVSHFAHRGRLQSFLRGRFLRTGPRVEEDRPPSSAAGELGQLRQRRAVSGLREGFRYRLETIVRDQATQMSARAEQRVQDEVQRRREAHEQAASLVGTSGRVGERGNSSQGVSRDWQGIAAVRRMSELRSLEDATAYNMELRELLGRRSVTNLLASEFRDRLDQLIRSFITHRPLPWPVARPGPPPQPPQQQNAQPQEQEQVLAEDEALGRANAVVPAAALVPPPPPPPPQPAWQQEFQQTNWPRPALQHPSYVWDNGNDLRADVARLQQGLGDLQRMVEACMDMQLELQRSIRQEVAGALQRMYAGGSLPEGSVDGSNWTPVKKGTCCICCDTAIDSLLYRCGHMCTCLKCATMLMQNGSKCPMCRAPIVEVVRAFTIA